MVGTFVRNYRTYITGVFLPCRVNLCAVNPARLCIVAVSLGLGLISGWADALDTWTKENSGVGANLNGITYGQGRFVAVGQGMVTLVSSNGADWSLAVGPGISGNLLGSAYANGVFVAVGAGGDIRRSTNGVNWIPVSSPTTNSLNGVGYGNGLFIATGNAGTLLTSPDGITWTSRVSGTTKHLMGVTWGNNLHMAVGKDNSSPGTVLMSADGVSWVNRSLGVGFYGAAYGAGTFVAMDARGVAYRSTTTTNWASVITAGGDYINGLTYAQGFFVGAGGPYLGGAQTVTTSPDGALWKQRSVNVTNSASLKAVTYGNGRFVAVGEKGMILRAGPIFTLRPPVLSSNAVAFLLAGEKGRVYRVQSSTNAAASWQDLLNVTNTDEATPFSVPIGPEESRLYRALTD